MWTVPTFIQNEEEGQANVWEGRRLDMKSGHDPHKSVSRCGTVCKVVSGLLREMPELTASVQQLGLSDLH